MTRDLPPPLLSAGPDPQASSPQALGGLQGSELTSAEVQQEEEAAAQQPAQPPVLTGLCPPLNLAMWSGRWSRLVGGVGLLHPPCQRRTGSGGGCVPKRDVRFRLGLGSGQEWGQACREHVHSVVLRVHVATASF